MDQQRYGDKEKAGEQCGIKEHGRWWLKASG
jgi:hypothetical protein